MVLVFKLLQVCELIDKETNFILIGVNFVEGKESNNILDQVKDSLRKDVGRRGG